MLQFTQNYLLNTVKYKVYNTEHFACVPSRRRETRSCKFTWKGGCLFSTHDISVVHPQDRLLSCQLCPTFPQGLEGKVWSRQAPSEYRSLNRANGLGWNPDSSHRLRPQPIRGLPTIEPGTFWRSSWAWHHASYKREACARTRGTSFWPLALSTWSPLWGPVLCSWQESRAFPQGYSCRFNSKKCLYVLLFA